MVRMGWDELSDGFVFISESVGREFGARWLFCLKPFLMPLIDFAFRLKPVREIAPVFATALLPEFMRSLGDLFFQTNVFVHLKNRRGSLVRCFDFHGVYSCQKAKQSQPRPKNPA